MPRYIVSITACDRSGIIAGISQGIVDLGGNIHAASQTVHQGYFAMIILVQFEREITDTEIADRIVSSTGRSDLHVYAAPYRPPAPEPDESGSPFIVTSIGPDKPGILNTLSKYLANRGVNIDDLYCVVEEGNFVVICQVTIPAAVDVFTLQTDLEAVGRKGGFSVTMQHENIFEKTNHP